MEDPHGLIIIKLYVANSSNICRMQLNHLIPLNHPLYV